MIEKILYLILAVLMALTLASVTIVVYTATAPGLNRCPEHVARQDTLSVIYGLLPPLAETMRETAALHKRLARDIAEGRVAR